ncbi:MAG: Bifunctional NMN adenylyltransferase/Nudix hydrolase [Microgenomates bacterium OLB23]|nr:MAG: Bifunctional NMN adenylyltransferase/Nudix hydrolase [Microgenomates bacterium OLB23]
MHIEDAFIYCPRCGEKLSQHRGGFPHCSYCGLHCYINPKPTTAVVIFNKSGDILLTKRGIEPFKGYWDLPGGFITVGETIIESAKREIKEELQVDINIDNIFDAVVDEYEYQGVIYPTLATVITAHIVSGTLKASDDVVDFAFFSPKEALQQQLAFSTVDKAITMATGLK